MRRTLRIFPIYYGLLFALCIIFLFIKPHANSAHSFFALIPFYFTYTSNWITQHAANLSITWSLATEEQFYLIWPAIEKFLKGWWLILVLIIVIIINQLMNFRVIDPWFQEWFGVGHADLNILQVTFTPIALGVGLAHLLHHLKGFSTVFSFLGRRSSVVICFILLFVACNIPIDGILGWPRLLIHVCMAMLLASCVVQETHFLAGILKWFPMQRIGVISYGMYLYHMWTRHLAVEILDRFSITSAGSLFVLCFVLTVIAAELSYRFYELPFLKLKHRFVRT